MAILVANVSSGKGTWAHLYGLIEKQEWDKIILITDNFGKENFKPKKNAEFVEVDYTKMIPELSEDIRMKLCDKIPRTELDVALSMISGTGKEHMALLSALLRLGTGIRLVTLTKEGIKEI